MKRSEFLKKLGIGIGVAIAAPRVLTSQNVTSGEPTKEIDWDKEIDKYRIYKRPLTCNECYQYYLGDEVCDWDGNRWIVVSVPILIGIPKDYKYVIRPIRDDVNFGHDKVVDAEVFPHVFRPTGASVLLKFNG